MDPITAVSLAASILTFVDFSWKVVTGARELYQSSSGQAAEDTHISNIIANVQEAADDLDTDNVENSKHGRALRKLASECVSSSKELISLLKSLRNERHTAWGSIKLQLARMRKKGEITELERRISDYRSIISLRLSLMMKDQQLGTITILRDVKDIMTRYQIQSDQKLEALKDDIFKASERLEIISSQSSATQSETEDARLDTDQASMDTLLDLVQKLDSSILESSLQQRILKQLWFPSMYSRQDGLGPATDGTFGWVLTEDQTYRDSQELVRDSFLSWLREDASMFHISGKAGSGKSTLMKLISEHSITRRELENWAKPKALVSAHFYFWKQDNLSMPREGFYRSILFQTLLQCPDLTQVLFPTQWAKFTNKSNPTCAPDESLFRFSDFQEAFKRLATLQDSPTHRFCYFVDGLDEYKGTRLEHDDLAQDLRAWAQNSGVKILTSARPHSEFLDTFDIAGNVVIHLQDLTQSDIYHFTSQALESSATRTSGTNDSELRELAREISRRAEGVFLWAVLVVRLLKTSMRFDDPPEVQRAKLESIPDDLNSLYDELLGTIESIDVPRSNRLLLVAAKNPFLEPLEALCYKWIEPLYQDPDFPRGYDFQIQDPEEAINTWVRTLRRQLDLLTRGLLQVTQDEQHCRVQFFHRTVRDFLSTDEKQRYLRHFFPHFSDKESYIHLRLSALAFRQRNSVDLMTLPKYTSFLHDIGIYCHLKTNIRKQISIKTLYTLEGVLRELQWSPELPPLVRFTNFAVAYGQKEYVMEQVRQHPEVFSGIRTHNLLLSSLFGCQFDLATCLLNEGYSLTDLVSSSTEEKSKFPVWMIASCYLINDMISVSQYSLTPYKFRPSVVPALEFLSPEGAPKDALIFFEHDKQKQLKGHEKQMYINYTVTLGSLMDCFRLHRQAHDLQTSKPSHHDTVVSYVKSSYGLGEGGDIGEEGFESGVESYHVFLNLIIKRKGGLVFKGMEHGGFQMNPPFLRGIWVR